MRKMRWALLAVLVGGALVAATQVSARTESLAAKPPIKIGISLPLTGNFSEPGTAAQRGYQVWRDLVNKHGGLLGRKIQLIIRDDASNQNTIVSDYNRLISEDKVDLLLGTFSSLLNLPASAVAEKFHMVYVEPAGGSPAMFSRGFKYLFFAQQATAPHQADLFSNWVRRLPKAKRPKTAAYPTQDDPFTKPVIQGIQAKLEAAGIKTVYSKVYAPDTTDFDTIAAGIKSSGADLVAEGAVFDDGVGIIRSFKKLGYNPRVLFETSAPSESSLFSKAIGVKNTEGIFYAVSWSPSAKGKSYPKNQEFLKAYKKQYQGKLPAEDAADAFAAAQVLETAVRKVGKIDQDKIRDYLHSHAVKTILGPLSWDSRGAPRQAFLLAQWQRGKSQIVLPKVIATTKKIIFPKPNWK
ncbi:MAG TPA: amino acid ABC transporter substrate-binding protein, partial [Gaiellaceae bacterium]|nr:amino acid ABC transporter substrate-binding protein [Gaiellaceae bacterium]